IEIKNMNSFSGVRRALEYEIPRQIEIVKSGGKLIQSTRRWDDMAGVTEEMRTKEFAHDYRYFPDPDLMPLAPTDEWLAKVKLRVVELPLARKQRFMRDYQLPASDAEVFKNDIRLGDSFEEEIKTVFRGIQDDKKIKLIKLVANLFINSSQLNDSDQSETIVPAKPFLVGETLNLAILIQNNTTNSSTAQQIILPEMRKTGKSAATVIQEKGLAQVSDTGAIEKFCNEVIAANPGPANDFKSGKVAALNFLKGQVMKLSKGKANPALVGEILERKLKG
ncbi:MAG TPA: Asp-tRNA(Asn)/Glu-tRNA(Gln) amidotransferase GatCAB subunit B, partial [Candidatus Paceibacterota bacterium]|nr:Asp-tRNA(Asn)/Glu-tRNA(Gln) amidotransferase GatCAB subunit B [Candidatus Paceibacterota bacterium]